MHIYTHAHKQAPVQGDEKSDGICMRKKERKKERKKIETIFDSKCLCGCPLPVS